MIVIVEGIDRVGKTTFCNKLSESLNIPIYKKDRVNITASARDSALINLGDAIGTIDFWNSNCKYESIIVDRFYWTEYVYTKIERYHDISKDNIQAVENRMMTKRDNYIIVYVRPTNVEWSSSRHGSSLQPHLSEFDELFSASKLNILVTDFNHLDETCKQVISIIKTSEELRK